MIPIGRFRFTFLELSRKVNSHRSHDVDHKHFEGDSVQHKTDLAPRIVTLGTAGGPRWWSSRTGQHRHGIATAVVVGEDYYLVDAGVGAGRQLERAGLPFDNLRAVFVTQLHSDHTVELPSWLSVSREAGGVQRQ